MPCKAQRSLQMRYRLYLYNAAGVCAADDFFAVDDTEALEVGAMLVRVTNDVCDRHEVWSGARHVTGAAVAAAFQASTFGTASEARELRALELEERLASSFTCIRRSKALLA